jgi:hypothetical protein
MDKCPEIADHPSGAAIYARPSLSKRREIELKSVLTVMSVADGARYRVSVIEQRKWIKAAEQDIFSNRVNVVRRRVDAEAAVWSGNLLMLWLKPKILIYFMPDVPSRLSFSEFCGVARQIVESVNLSRAASGDFDRSLKEICEPHALCVLLGSRRVVLTLRRLPCLFLMECQRGAKSTPAFESGRKTLGGVEGTSTSEPHKARTK